MKKKGDRIKRKVLIRFKDKVEIKTQWEHGDCTSTATVGHPKRMINIKVELHRIMPDGWFIYEEV